jgi:hypothetical protein
LRRGTGSSRTSPGKSYRPLSPTVAGRPGQPAVSERRRFAFKHDRFGLWYAFLETDLNLGPDLKSNYAAGVGGSTGVMFDISDFWKVVFSARDIYYGLGDTTNFYKFALMQNFATSTNTAIAADISMEESQAGKEIFEFGIRFNLYF